MSPSPFLSLSLSPSPYPYPFLIHPNSPSRPLHSQPQSLPPAIPIISTCYTHLPPSLRLHPVSSPCSPFPNGLNSPSCYSLIRAFHLLSSTINAPPPYHSSCIHRLILLSNPLPQSSPSVAPLPSENDLALSLSEFCSIHPLICVLVLHVFQASSPIGHLFSLSGVDAHSFSQSHFGEFHLRQRRRRKRKRSSEEKVCNK